MLHLARRRLATNAERQAECLLISDLVSKLLGLGKSLKLNSEPHSGVLSEVIQHAVRIASVVHAVAALLDAEQTTGTKAAA